MLGNVTGVDAASKQVIVDADDKVGLRISYDYPIPTTGATHSYFGHDEFAAFTPGLKSLSHAESLRNQLPEAFEKAEIEDDSDRRKALVTVLAKELPLLIWHSTSCDTSTTDPCLGYQEPTRETSDITLNRVAIGVGCEQT